MNTEPNWDLLRQAITIIHAVDDEKIDLDEVIGQNCRPNDPPCSTTTIADPFGHLAMNDRFAQDNNLKVLRLAGGDYKVVRQSAGNVFVGYSQLICELFNLPVADAHKLFGVRRDRDDDTGEYGYEDFTDKQLFEQRCADYFHEHKQPFPTLTTNESN